MTPALPLVLVTALVGLPQEAIDTVRVVIVATTDVHGHVYHWDYVRDEEAPWGLTRAATLIDSLRRDFPGGVIVLDAGDLIQGSPFATFFAEERVIDPNPVIDALNVVGYDAATPGNHEFNFGLDLFSRAVRGAAFPLVSANIFRMPRDTLALAPFVVVTRQDVRVGITGFTTPGAMVWDRENLDGRVLVRPILSEATKTLQSLADARVDLRIAIIHSGMDGPSSYDTTLVGEENVAARLAALPVRPHIVIVGHTHRTMADSVINGVHFVQAPPHARGLAVAHVLLERRTDERRGRAAIRVLGIAGETIPLADVPPDPVVTRRLASAHESVRSWVSQPLAEVVDGDWSAWAGRAEDTPVIDFVNEVQRRVGSAQLSATAAFNTRARLGPGEIRLRDVAGLYPYENTLKVVRIDGAVLKAYLEQSARYFHTYENGRPPINDSVPGFNFDIVSGVDYAIDLTKPFGERIRELTFKGLPVQPTDTFTLALNSYRQSGGGGFEMLRGLPVVYDGGDIRELLLEHLQTVRYLRAADYFEPSWRIVPSAAAAAVRAAFGIPARVVVETEEPTGAVDTLVPVHPAPHLPFEAPAPNAAPVAQIKLPLVLAGAEHGLGRLVADAYRRAARTHVAIAHSARLVAGLRSGHVSEAEVARVIAEPGMLVRVRVSGRLLRELLEHAVNDGEPVIHVSGVTVRYDPSRPAGRRVRDVRLTGGDKLQDRDEYDLVLPESLVPVPGAILVPTQVGVTIALEDAPRVDTGLSEVEALRTFLNVSAQPVEAPPTPRFRIAR